MIELPGCKVLIIKYVSSLQYPLFVGLLLTLMLYTVNGIRSVKQTDKMFSPTLTTYSNNSHYILHSTFNAAIRMYLVSRSK